MAKTTSKKTATKQTGGKVASASFSRKKGTAVSTSIPAIPSGQSVRLHVKALKKLAESEAVTSPTSFVVEQVQNSRSLVSLRFINHLYLILMSCQYCSLCDNGGTLIDCNDPDCRRACCDECIPLLKELLAPEFPDEVKFECPSCHLKKNVKDRGALPPYYVCAISLLTTSNDLRRY